MDDSARQTLNALPELLQSVFDLIMEPIEPELTSGRIFDLEKVYADESEQEKAARMERYRKAYVRFDQERAAYLHRLKPLLNPEAARWLDQEMAERRLDDQIGSDLLNAISNAA
jgi:hypothetical protein